MIELGSNGNRYGTEKPYMGDDPGVIVYTDVDTCITVTCVVSKKLTGIHLARTVFPTDTEGDLEKFGKMSNGASAMYIVGMLSKEGTWTSGTKNRTGLTYQVTGGGTLVEKLRKHSNYAGVVNVYDTSNCAGIDIKAQFAGEGATLSYALTGNNEYKVIDAFTQIAGNVIPQTALKNNKGCIIF